MNFFEPKEILCCTEAITTHTQAKTLEIKASYLEKISQKYSEEKSRAQEAIKKIKREAFSSTLLEKIKENPSMDCEEESNKIAKNHNTEIYPHLLNVCLEMKRIVSCIDRDTFPTNREIKAEESNPVVN